MGRFVGKIYTLVCNDECYACYNDLDSVLVDVQEQTDEHCETWEECIEAWEGYYCGSGEAYCWDVTISPEMLRYVE